METERDWQIVRRDDRWNWKDAGMGLLRFTLLFGLCAAALAVIAAPALQKRTETWLALNGRVDPISVGSTNAANVYTIRRSVLQPTPNSICVIRPNGTRSGDR